jgi:MarR family transcriptional regulator, negative regulator of the multidrug operon emrRAB
MIKQKLESMEANLARLSVLMPQFPSNEVLIVRLVLFLAHDLGMLLEQVLRPFGLGEGEFRVLTALFSQPQSTAHPGDLCVRALQKPANMSRITDALVKRDLITRVPSAQDRRKLVLRITKKGVALVHRALPDVFAPVRQLCSKTPVKDQERMIAELRDMLIRLNAVNESMACGKDP